MINVRAKGQVGEREIADDLNAILWMIHKELGIPYPDKPIVQRNQNQSAVGGCDLTGTFGLAIEVKRQEQLAINTWWAQCLKSAKERNEIPVLLFRQNAKPGQRTQWRCILEVEAPVPSAYELPVKLRAEISYEDFKSYFRRVAFLSLTSNLAQPSTITPTLITPGGIEEAPTRVRHPSLFEEAA